MTQSPSLPELPKLPEPDGYAAISTDGTHSIVVPPQDFAKHNGYAIFTADQMNAHYLKGYEAGRASRAQSEWISVDDRLPDERASAYLVAVVAKKTYSEGSNYPGMGIRSVVQDWVARNYASNYTHWMALPETTPAAPTQGAEGAAPQAVAAEIRDLLCELGNGVKASNWRLAERAFDMSARFLVDQTLAATADAATHDDSDDIAAEKAAQGYPRAES